MKPTGVIDICGGRENRRRPRDAKDYLKDRAERALIGTAKVPRRQKGPRGHPGRSKKQQITGFFLPARVLFINRTLPTWRTASIFVTLRNSPRPLPVPLVPSAAEQSTRFVREIRQRTRSLPAAIRSRFVSRDRAAACATTAPSSQGATCERPRSGIFLLNCELFVVYARQTGPSTQLRRQPANLAATCINRTGTPCFQLQVQRKISRCLKTRLQKSSLWGPLGTSQLSNDASLRCFIYIFFFIEI